MQPEFEIFRMISGSEEYYADGHTSSLNIAANWHLSVSFRSGRRYDRDDGGNNEMRQWGGTTAPSYRGRGAMVGETTIVHTADEREMKRLVKKGAVVMAEYDFRGSAVESLRARGRWWILRVPSTIVAERAA